MAAMEVADTKVEVHYEKGKEAASMTRVGLVMVCLFVVTMGNAFAVTMDEEGEARSCTMRCIVRNVALRSFDAVKSVYEVNGYCSYAPSKPDAACPQNEDVTGNAEWNRQTKQATENIVRRVTGSSALATVSSCPENPWAYDNIQCTLVSKNPATSTLPGPFPKSASLLSSAQKTSLRTGQGAGGAIAASPTGAPLFMSPASNQTFTAPAKIQVAVSHSPNWPILFEFQWRKDAQGTWTDVQGILLDNKKTASGLTGGEFNTSKTGQWRMRAIHNYPNTPYSVWVQVSVEELAMVPKAALTTRGPAGVPAPQTPIPTRTPGTIPVPQPRR
jgi:hypothetical protein